MTQRRQVTINYLMHKLKHGYAILSPFKGLSPSQFHSIVAAILGVGVGVAGLYMSIQDGKIRNFSIPLVSVQGDSSEILVAGLQNLGNNCFLNVILQALASCGYFLPFVQNILVNDDLVVEDETETIPLIVALASLLEDLSIVRDGKAVLSPRKVMDAMCLYVNSFNLTRQQDAAEALLHLLSSLEEEILQCYPMHDNSLANILSFPLRIYKPKRIGRNEYERWKQQFLGPFDGMTGSLLMCKSCSSTLSMDFEYFRCLPLSPVLDRSGEIMEGCSVVDCLKKFTVVEHVDYHCGQCWHIAASKYLSHKMEKDEAKLKMVGNCIKLDFCDCKNLFLKEEITWTGFSRAVKQLSIARCPRILCIHLQRASMNVHGELIKLQGHISFPLCLDLLPFMQATTSVGQGTLEEKLQDNEKRQNLALLPQLNLLNRRSEMQMLPHIYRIVGANETWSSNNLENQFCEPSTTSVESIFLRDTVLGSKTSASDFCSVQSFSMHETGENGKVKVSKIDRSSSKSCMYRLSSVVEHYGRPGSGHYAAYRRVASKAGSGVAVKPTENVNQEWVYVSDRDVSSVPEETVLAAEATLLFYERVISTN